MVSAERRITGAKVALTGEALAELALAAVIARCLPFRTFFAWLQRSKPSTAPSAMRADVIDAIRRATRLSPVRFVCLPQASAAFRMLRRRGVDARFVYGLSSADHDLSAHAWVEVGGKPVIGTDEALRHEPVASIPAAIDRIP